MTRPPIIRSEDPTACTLEFECCECGERFEGQEACLWCGHACDRVIVGPDGETLAILVRPRERVAYRRRFNDPLNLTADHQLIYRRALDLEEDGEQGFYADCVRKGHLHERQVAHFLTQHPGGL